MGFSCALEVEDFIHTAGNVVRKMWGKGGGGGVREDGADGGRLGLIGGDLYGLVWFICYMGWLGLIGGDLYGLVWFICYMGWLGLIGGDLYGLGLCSCVVLRSAINLLGVGEELR